MVGVTGPDLLNSDVRGLPKRLTHGPHFGPTNSALADACEHVRQNLSPVLTRKFISLSSADRGSQDN